MYYYGHEFFRFISISRLNSFYSGEDRHNVMVSFLHLLKQETSARVFPYRAWHPAGGTNRRWSAQLSEKSLDRQCSTLGYHLMMLLQKLSAGPQGNVAGGVVWVAVDPGRDARERLNISITRERDDGKLQLFSGLTPASSWGSFCRLSGGPLGVLPEDRLWRWRLMIEMIVMIIRVTE